MLSYKKKKIEKNIFPPKGLELTILHFISVHSIMTLENQSPIHNTKHQHNLFDTTLTAINY